jgi:hypothetical protein
MRNTGTNAFCIGLALITALTLGACAEHDGTSGTNTNSMPGMSMGAPSATPAAQVAGARLRTSPFTLLNTRPPGLDNATGTAWLATHPGGTTVTVEMMGLKPGDTYPAHLHAQPCSQNNGGPHFKFDPQGPAMPPNEVHLTLTADQGGHAFMTVTNQQAADGATSIVVHSAINPDNRIACADF